MNKTFKDVLSLVFVICMIMVIICISDMETPFILKTGGLHRLRLSIGLDISYLYTSLSLFLFVSILLFPFLIDKKK